MSEPPMPDPSRRPLDAEDDRILAGIDAAYGIVDPPPADLDERARFALRVGDLDFEISRLHELSAEGAGARDEGTTRTVTFESDALTVMVSVSDLGGDRRRLEGWAAPPGDLTVEVRVGTREQVFRVTAENGRFVFEDVPSGLVQFYVYQSGRVPGVVTSPMRI